MSTFSPSSWYGFCHVPVLSNLSSPCYQPAHSQFLFWYDGDFDLCFEETIIFSLSHAILAITSSYYIGSNHPRLKRRLPSIGLMIRGLVVLLLLANTLTKLIGSFWLVTDRPYAALLSQCVQVFSWLLHILCIVVLSRSFSHQGFGPLPLNLSWSLTLLSSVIQFRSVILYNQSTIPSSCNSLKLGYLSFFIQITSYIHFGLQMIYLLTLLIPAKRPNSSPYRPSSTQYTDTAPLLGNTIVTYDSITGLAPHPLNASKPLEDRANPLSLITFWWLQPLMKAGSLGFIQKPEDLPFLPRKMGTSRVRERFQHSMSGERPTMIHRSSGNQSGIEEQSLHSMHGSLRNLTSSQSNPVSLLRALNKSFGWHYYPLGLVKLFNDCLGFGGPLLLHQLVDFMENKTEPMYYGYLYALGLFLSTFITALLNSHFTFQVNKVGLKIRAAIVTEIFRKSLSVNSVNMSKFSTGQVVNYMSTDTDRIVNFCPSFHQFWSLPFQIAVSLYLLYRQVGLAFLAGVVFSILLIPINRWLAKKIGQLSTAMMDQKDQRVKLMTEILMSIRVIKFYAWERYFADRINTIRSSELHSLKGRKYLDALCVYFWATTPVLISILTFTTYVLIGNQLTAAKVFTSLALFNMLIGPLNAFPWVLNGLVEAWVSLKRVQGFLLLPETNLLQYYIINGGSHDNETMVTIEDCCYTWKREDGLSGTTAIEWTLNGINLTLRKGELMGVVGKVGAGKSSLLAAITAEMKIYRGQISVVDLNEGFGLVPQEPWIQFATLRDNILFGLPYEVDKYNEVVFACALQQDIQSLPAGDMTEVGENGVTLSGGQKARISLARAVYQNKDIYLLDDPLAAVDAHVANHIYTHCITGLLRDKARILCTHHISFLRDADCILVLNDGNMELMGPPSAIFPLLNETKHLQIKPHRKSTDNEKTNNGKVPESLEENDKTDGVLVKEEEKEEGVVRFSVYWSYWLSVGMFLAPAILISLVLMQASRNVSDWWLSYWISETRDNISNTTRDLRFYLGIYGGLAGANTFFTLFRAFIFAYGGIQAALVIHKKLLKTILKSPIRFFDITPIGRIINRFSSDVYCIDDSLPFILNIFLAQFFGLMGTLVITCYGLPWFIVLLVPLAVIYYYIQKYYRRTSRELKRLSTVTLSPVYAHFQETLTGLATIRSLRATQRFAQENEEKLEMSQRANYSSYAIAQWLSLRLQMLGVAMVGGVSLIAVLEHHFTGSIDPGLVGLAISYALSVTNLLSGVVTAFTETEKEMVSVERAMQYIKGTPNEPDQDDVLGNDVEWPHRGVIEFRKVSLRYRENLPYALKDVTFTINQFEKIGVVGRTGAGKSSIFQALFRMTDSLLAGTVLIDNIDIAMVPLKRLRSSMAIIPQDPFLFTGTVQENLDPHRKRTHGELWAALERCHLKLLVENMGGLDANIEDRGRELSVGQRQLMCLVRALLMQSKIICIDEATASVDLSTDAQIQQTIRTEFVTSTVITIAHRIDTILNCDRILVMDGGRVREFDKPGVLLGDPNSLFTLLFNEHKNKGRK